MLRLAVFDVDGTLVDSQAHILTAMAHAYGGAGLDCPPREAVLAIIGLSLPQAFARLEPQAEPALIERLVAGYKAAFGLVRPRMASPLFPGARAALDSLARREDVLLGVATGKSRRGLDHMLAEHRLEGYFVTRQVADDHPSKPHPSMLLAALGEAGADAGMTVMIGDTSYDMEMGRAAGCRRLGVAWGYHSADELLRAGAERVIAGYAALLPALEELWAEA